MLLVDNDFRNLIPPLTAEEYNGLEKSILKEGCRDALVVWNGTIIDGHNRYDICTKYNIPFKTVEKEFDSVDDAKIWIIDNQLNRRNLPKFVRHELKGKKKEILLEQGREKYR